MAIEKKAESLRCERTVDIPSNINVNNDKAYPVSVSSFAFSESADSQTANSNMMSLHHDVKDKPKILSSANMKKINEMSMNR